MQLLILSEYIAYLNSMVYFKVYDVDYVVKFMSNLCQALRDFECFHLQLTWQQIYDQLEESNDNLRIFIATYWLGKTLGRCRLQKKYTWKAPYAFKSNSYGHLKNDYIDD